MKPDAAIAVFLEAPRLGVKPRLAEDVGPHHALRLYRVLAARTLAAVRDQGLPAVVWFHPAEAQAEMRHWLGSDWPLRPQASGALNARVAASSQGVEPGHPWIVILSESVGLVPEVVTEACDALIDFPAVLGPATDGGCYLLGARTPLPGLAAALPNAGPPLDALREALAQRAPQPRELRLLRCVETGADARAAGLIT